MTLTDRVRLEIEKSLQSGALRPGDALDDKELARRFKTSRTPVREALLQLETLGFVEIVPRAGSFVARADAKQLFCLIEALAHVEGVAVELATDRLSAAARRGLTTIHKEGAEAVRVSNGRQYAGVNQRFHEAIYEGSANVVVAGEARLLRRRLSVFQRDVFDVPARLTESHREHDAVLRAMVAGNASSARSLMTAHIAAGGRTFTRLVLGGAA
jgi:DNA-binding GntR family transcriptional regulator